MEAPKPALQFRRTSIQIRDEFLLASSPMSQGRRKIFGGLGELLQRHWDEASARVCVCVYERLFLCTVCVWVCVQVEEGEEGEEEMREPGG